MAYVREDIEAQLQRIKENKKRQEYMTPRDYKQFLPKSIGYKPREMDMMYQHLDQIKEKGTDATTLAMIQAQNKRNRDLMLQKQRELRAASRNLRNSKNNSYNINVSGGGGGGGGDYDVAPTGPFKAGVGEYLKTVNWRGHNFTVNTYVADRFVGFLNGLYKMGYRPASIGGYNNRNIAGSNQKSLHAYGLAIDIDPSRNPVQSNDGSMSHALPPRVGALAAKYGLSWGGSWNSYKDPMHFSVPYGGRE